MIAAAVAVVPHVTWHRDCWPNGKKTVPPLLMMMPTNLWVDSQEQCLGCYCNTNYLMGFVLGDEAPDDDFERQDDWCETWSPLALMLWWRSK